MTRTLITGPTEPITLAQAKLHMRVEHDADGSLITGFITAARETAEHELGRPIEAQAWRISLDAFPPAELHLGPDVTSITSIQYLDAAGDLQTLAAEAYVLDTGDPTASFVLPADGYEWPATADAANAVRLQIVCGLTPLPEVVRAWMLLRIGTLYQHRAEVAAGSSLSPLPGGFADRLLDRYRVYA